MNTIPKATLIIGYKEFFNELPPDNRLSILTGICKRHLIAEFVGLNWRLKPNNSRFYDISLSRQIKELEYFTAIDPELHQQYAAVAEKFTANLKEYPLIFTRQTCTFALEETIQSDLPVIEDFSMANVGVWNSIFKYILSVNTTITEIGGNIDEVINFETLNPKMLPLNELALDTDPFSIPFRAYSLFEFLASQNEVGELFADYLQRTFGITFDRYVYDVLQMYLANKRENSAFDFAYHVSAEDSRLFEAFSHKFPSDEIYKLLSIRKYPFYKSKEYSYLLTDNILLLEKLYSQFINDFWFDYLKPIAKWNIKKYKSIIGYFFESYVKGIIDHAFQNAKYYVVRQFQELVTNYKGNQIEIADLYVRSNSKVLLGQVKSTTLYDTEKYSGNIDLFYKNDREKFFTSFGVDQIVQSVKMLNDVMLQVDSRFPRNKSLHVYPVIIFSEKSLQTPLMAKVFHERFVELMGDFHSKKIYVYPLSLIHISDLENIQDWLQKKPGEIWDLLKYHFRFPKFMPPFYNSINRRDIRPTHQRTMTLYRRLIPKFSGEQNAG